MNMYPWDSEFGRFNVSKLSERFRVKFKKMPFIDLSLPERENFLKSITESYIPGYTGHCPTLKFRYGKPFATDTREIIRMLKDRPLTFDMKPYKEDSPQLAEIKETRREKGQEFDPSIFTNLPRRSYILGYTGFIPGLNFRYGSTFAAAANESVEEFTKKLFKEKKARERDQFQFSNVTTKAASVRNRDEVKRLLQYYTNRTSIKPESKVSFELPPIAGYTGHIPRLVGSETSLSRSYHAAAKAGLAQLREEKNRVCHIEMAKEAIKNAIACSHTSQ